MIKNTIFKHKFLVFFNILTMIITVVGILLSMYFSAFEIVAIIHGNWTKFIFWIGISSFSIIIGLSSRSLSNHLTNRLIQVIVFDIRVKMAEKSGKLKYFSFNENKIQLENSYIYDSMNYAIRNILNIFRIISSILYIGVAFILFFTFSWVLALVAVGYVLVLFFYSFLKTKSLSIHNKNISDSRAKANHFVNDSTQAFKKIHFMNKHNVLWLINKKNLIDYSAKVMKKDKLVLWKNTPLSLFESINNILFYFVIGYIVIKWNYNPGIFVAISSIKYFVSNSAAEISQSLFSLKGIDSIRKKILVGLNLEERVEGKISSNEIKISNMNFEIDKQKILENINLDFSANDKILIVGESGVGKSTLIKVILGILKPTKGKVLWGNDSPDIDQMYNNVSFIKNNPKFIFDEVDDNICLSKNKGDDKEKITNAKKLAKINFENEINSLSEGQKQRVEIASALYCDSPTMIFDEGFANIDHKTSHIIMNNLLKMKNKQIFIITHHISQSQMKKFDKVIRLTNNEYIKSLVTP